MRKFVCVLLISVLVSSFSFISVATAKGTWNANSQWAPNNYHSKALKEFADRVYKKTNGELEIIVQYSGALGYKGPELLQAVQDNLVQMSLITNMTVAGYEMIFGVNSLPMMGPDVEKGRIFTEICRPYFDKAAEKWNQKILWIGPWYDGLWTKKKVSSVEDLKGMKIRTYDKISASVIDALGGVPYALPWSDVYTSVATGMIDAVLTSGTTGAEGKLWEVMDYFQPIMFMLATEMVTVNLAEFNKLSPELQNFMVQAAKEIEDQVWSEAVIEEEGNIKLLAKHGVEIVPVSEAYEAEVVSKTEIVRQEWLKNAPPEALEIYEKAKKAFEGM